MHELLALLPLLPCVPISAAASKAPLPHELDRSYTFAEYLSDFGKSYDGEEYERRSRIFGKNVEKILKHNRGRLSEAGEVKSGFAMGINAFADMESHELATGYDKMMHPAWRSQLRTKGFELAERALGGSSYEVPPAFPIDEVSELPASRNWLEEGVVNPVVPSQGGCGSCWAFATTASVECHLALATGEEPFSLSQQSILSCTPNPQDCGGEGGCTGSTGVLAYSYLAKVSAQNTGGMFSLDDVPYTASNKKCNHVVEGKSPLVGIQGYTLLPSNNYKVVMNALAKVGPLQVNIAADALHHYTSGIIDSDATTINHAVLLVGYGTDETTGEDYWLVRNSWGPDFGEDGYFRLKRTSDDSNVCGMDTDPHIGLGCALDEHGNPINLEPVEVCGPIGILFDVSYPVGTYLLD